MEMDGGVSGSQWIKKMVRISFMREPVLPGCFLRAKAIGVMPMIDQGEKDDKIIDVCADDPVYRHYNDFKELPPHRLAEIRRFFEDYKKNENKEVVVNDFLPTSTAYEAVQHSIDRAKAGQEASSTGINFCLLSFFVVL